MVSGPPSSPLLGGHQQQWAGIPCQRYGHTREYKILRNQRRRHNRQWYWVASTSFGIGTVISGGSANKLLCADSSGKVAEIGSINGSVAGQVTFTDGTRAAQFADGSECALFYDGSYTVNVCVTGSYAFEATDGTRSVVLANGSEGANVQDGTYTMLVCSAYGAVYANDGNNTARLTDGYNAGAFFGGDANEAYLCDGNNHCAGYFLNPNNNMTVQIASNSEAGYFTDGTTSLIFCNGTYAIQSSGPNSFAGTTYICSAIDQLSFFGVTPAAQQIGGAASAGATYTATEQAIRPTLFYAALQAYGLLS